MKKILYTLLFLIPFVVKAQHPVGTDSLALQTLGSSNTLVKSKGALASDSGFVIANYADTAAANRGKLKNYPGAQIRTGDTIWVRNSMATAWIQLIGNSNIPDAYLFFDSTINTGYFHNSGPDKTIGVNHDIVAFLSDINNTTSDTLTGDVGFPTQVISIVDTPLASATDSSVYLITKNPPQYLADGTTPNPYYTHHNDAAQLIDGDWVYFVPNDNQTVAVASNSSFYQYYLSTDLWKKTNKPFIVGGSAYGINQKLYVKDSNDLIIGTDNVERVRFTRDGHVNFPAKSYAGTDTTHAAYFAPNGDLVYLPSQQLTVDGTTITGDGTPGNPLVSHATGGTGSNDPDSLGGLAANDYEVKSNKQTTLDNSTTHYPSTSAVTTALATKLNITDTSIINAEIVQLRNALPLKLNISDTASMLSPYLRKIDTTNKWVQQVNSNAGGDSLIVVKNGTRTAYKYPSGTGSGDSTYPSLSWYSAQANNILPSNSAATNTTNLINLVTSIRNTLKGGVVVFKAADSAYKFTNVNLPAFSSDSIQTIVFMGTQPPEKRFGTVGTAIMPSKGVILQSFSTSGALISVTASGGGFSKVSLILKNLDLRTYDQPQITAVDAGWANRLMVQDCFIETGVLNPTSLIPYGGTYGIITPKINNGASTVIERTAIVSYYVGIDANEHTSGDNIDIGSCVQAIRVEAGYHALNFGRVGFYRNQINIYGAGANAIHIALANIERADTITQTDAGTAWQVTQADLKDTANLLSGEINWWETHGNTAVHHEFTQVGGDDGQLIVNELGFPKYALKTRFNQFTKRNTFAKQVNVLDSMYVHGRFGIGDSTFADKVSIKDSNSSTSYNLIKIANTHASGQSIMTFENNTGGIGSIGGYGGSWVATPNAQNNIIVAAKNDLLLQASDGVSTGGTNKVGISSTGYSASPTLEVFGSSGTVRIGGSSTGWTLPLSAPVADQYLGQTGTGTSGWLTRAKWQLSGTSAYYNTGNVGIGTSSPGSDTKLDVVVADNNYAFRVRGATVTGSWYMSSTNMQFGTETNHAQLLYTNNTNRGAIQNGGGWAIGNSTHITNTASLGSGYLDVQNGIGVNITGTPADKLEMNGNINLSTAGNKIKIATGTNASVGTSTLSSGTVTVSTTAVTASSKIFVTHAGSSVTNAGVLYIGTITAGTSFVITSTNASDNDTVNWWIIN